MTIKPFLVLGLGATTIASGVGIIYAINYNNAVSIEKEIVNSKRTILSQDAKTWDIKLSTYNKSFKSEVNLDTEDQEGLKKWCKNTLKSNFKNNEDKLFLQAKFLCTIPTNKEKLLHNQKELSDDADWKTKLSSYNNTGSNQNPIEGIAKGSAKQDELKKWCKETWEKEITEVETEYTLSVKWCTKGG